MLTIFTCPKPFNGHTALIQRNAIESWLLLGANVQIILCGDDDGVAEVAQEYGVEHIPRIECNNYGTPLLNSIFSNAAKVSRNRLLCYVNSDIILGKDLFDAVRIVKRWHFVVVARRRCIDIDRRLYFNKSNNVDLLPQLVARADDFDLVDAIDMILFTRCVALVAIPGFAVGRPAWDNWFLMNALKHWIPVVDATGMITVIHQNHGYEHVSESLDGKSWEGPEADENRSLAGGWKSLFTIDDSTHKLTKDGMCAISESERVWRRVERMAMLRPLFWRLCVCWKIRYFLCRIFSVL